MIFVSLVRFNSVKEFIIMIMIIINAGALTFWNS